MTIIILSRNLYNMLSNIYFITQMSIINMFPAILINNPSLVLSVHGHQLSNPYLFLLLVFTVKVITYGLFNLLVSLCVEKMTSMTIGTNDTV